MLLIMSRNYDVTLVKLFETLTATEITSLIEIITRRARYFAKLEKIIIYRGFSKIFIIFQFVVQKLQLSNALSRKRYV